MQTKVTEAISKLPAVYRSVVILRDLEGLSYQEIADVLNTRISKVKSNLFRGRRRLKDILRPFFEVSM
jgi:RNA polymerase sigma-70 factor (ECF subfamily)